MNLMNLATMTKEQTMEPCDKRQKIVTRATGAVTFRCINKQCGLHGEKVDEGICSRCPVRSVRRKPHCPDRSRPTGNPGPSPSSNPNIISTEEMLSFSDADVREMIEEAGLDLDEFERPLTVDGSTPPDYPSLSMQAWTYKEALLRWNKAGRPKRSQQEVDDILETHCKKCDWYDSDQKRCRGCGCRVSESSIAIFNKIKMGTEHCPKELW